MNTRPYKKPPLDPQPHTQLETKVHYVRAINTEFRNLQLDANLKLKSIFDLIDYCELLYEELLELVNTEEGLTTYIKGYLIFNYFINSFIMVHFQGFDQFIASNHQDFILYLNVFAFYNTDDIIRNDLYVVPLPDLRKWVLEYLSSKSLLSFDVNELYAWLYDYIDYLKKAETPDEDSEDDLQSFKARFPSVKLSRPPSPPSPPTIPELPPPNMPPPSIPPLPQELSPLNMPPPSIPQERQHRVSPSIFQKAAPYPDAPYQDAPYPKDTPYPATDSWDDLHFTAKSPQIPPLHRDSYSHSLESLHRDYARPAAVVPPVPSQVHANGSFNGSRRPSGPKPLPSYPVQPSVAYHPASTAQQNPHYSAKAQKLHYMREFSICGLKNFGSSCYINSIIQLLFGAITFKHLFSNLEYHKYVRNPKFIRLMKLAHTSRDLQLLSEAISGLLRTFTMHGSLSIAPTKFLRVASTLKADFNIPHEQQDAQEFLLFVLERLHEELSYKEYEPPERYLQKWNIHIDHKDRTQYLKWIETLLESEGTSPINDMFQGHLQNKLICNQCGFESINYSPFTILSLPIPNTNVNRLTDLADCLRYYTQDEVLTGDNAWHCPKCNKTEPQASLDNHPVFTPKRNGIFRLAKRSKSPSKKPEPTAKNTSISIKTLTFIKLPQVLLIHLSRFSMYNFTDKLDTVIKYPLVLTFKDPADRSKPEITYKLAGLINHYGNLKSGHYTALVNKANVSTATCDDLRNPYWCLFDDETVRLNLAHGAFAERRDPNLRDVYVLCYERVTN